MSNNRDDLLLSIMEKLADDMSDVKKDVTSVKVEQARQGEVLASNTITLDRHEFRSTQLGLRLDRLEKFEQFFKNGILIISTLGGISLFLIKILPYFSGLLH